MGAVCSTWKMAASLPEACGRVSEKNENMPDVGANNKEEEDRVAGLSIQ